MILDLGLQPLANSFLRQEEVDRPEPRYPLELRRCSDCGHVQLSVTVPPETMFRNYPYVTGTSETLRRHFAAYANDITARFLPAQSAFVVEIGSNDGTLLGAFDRPRTRVLGVEPAANIASMANAAGIETLNDFFSERVADDIASRHGRADAILANNVVAHIDDLHGLVRGIDALLSPSGVFVAEFPYLVDLLDRVEYDTIYHEHLSYFSVRTSCDLFARFGLTLFEVRRVPVHGGSLRIFVARGRAPTSSVEELIALERGRGLDGRQPLTEFAERVRRQRESLTAMVSELKRNKKRIAAYGAAAKGNTLLNYCGLDHATIDFIADRSPLKQGMLAPGSRIPVRDPEYLLRDLPEYALMLAWNFEEEILRQQADYRAAGGRFIVPIPEPRIV